MLISSNIAYISFSYLQGNSLSTIRAGALPPRLSIINLQENPLKVVDEDAFNGSADTLTQLWLSNALFTELPSALLHLNNLTRLTIEDTHINTWDLDIMKHIGTTLQTLTLRNVGLTSWPEWIPSLLYLGTLELFSVPFKVPDNAFDVQTNTLFSLSLENGILTEIPIAVTKLTRLQKLLLDNNNISRASGIPSSPVLSELSMANNKISDAGQLSDALHSIAGSLTYLQLNENLLIYLPDLSAMTKLKTVYISNNSIAYSGNAKIPPSLQYLGLEQNKLKSVESFLQQGHSLTVLDVKSNSIKVISGADIPVSVQDLDISLNLLTELTDESFPQDSNMSSLTLDSNPISQVSSKAFARLTKLSFLSMIYTKITRLPLSLAHLTNAVSIDLTGNDDLICTCAEKELRSLPQLHQVEIYGQCGVTTVDNFLNVMSQQCPD